MSGTTENSRSPKSQTACRRQFPLVPSHWLAPMRQRLGQQWFLTSTCLIIFIIYSLSAWNHHIRDEPVIFFLNMKNRNVKQQGRRRDDLWRTIVATSATDQSCPFDSEFCIANALYPSVHLCFLDDTQQRGFLDFTPYISFSEFDKKGKMKARPSPALKQSHCCCQYVRAGFFTIKTVLVKMHMYIWGGRYTEHFGTVCSRTDTLSLCTWHSQWKPHT